jgi:4-hydroxy-3-polyprenylbenzoate decarboxylase
MRRIIVAITGASGSIYGLRALEVLAKAGDVETHLIVSRGAATTLQHELDRPVADLNALADVVHDDDDLAASIASGSYRVDGMVVAPCSIKTLSGIAHSYDDNLVIRAADVRLKERQPLVLLVREAPLHLGHLRLMTAAAEAGAVIFPPVPSLYNRPSSIDELVDHTIMRVCDQLAIETDLSGRWHGLPD